MCLMPMLPTLANMKGRAGAKVIDWFTAYALELPEEQGNVCRAAGTAFVAKTMKITLGSLFKMEGARAERILDSVGADLGWLETIEEEAGFKFAVLPVPAISTLVAPDSDGQQRVSSGKRTQRSAGRPPTLSAELFRAGTLYDQTVPEECFRHVHTKTPLVHRITEVECNKTTAAVVLWCAAIHGRCNLGVGLCTQLGRQLQDRLPMLPVYGKNDERNWESMLRIKAENLVHVRCPSNPPTACSLSPTVIFPACAENSKGVGRDQVGGRARRQEAGVHSEHGQVRHD